MKYIEKTIENEQGYEVTCWVAVSGSFSLDENKGTITLLGWKDVQSYTDKKAPSHSITEIFALTDLQGFESLWGETAMKLITTGTFINGTIKDTTEGNPTT